MSKDQPRNDSASITGKAVTIAGKDGLWQVKEVKDGACSCSRPAKDGHENGTFHFSLLSLAPECCQKRGCGHIGGCGKCNKGDNPKIL